MKLHLLTCFAGLASAHFRLNYPKSRGFDEDQLVKFPCGGQNAVSKSRTDWPIAGGSIALEMGHDRANVQVLLGLGDDVGDNYNITLVPTVQEQGEGDFCFKTVPIPKSLGIKDGQMATIQVVTNGDPMGGLYNCADITFRTNAPADSSCKNGTGVGAMPMTGQEKNANETSASGQPASKPQAGSSTTAAASPAKTGTAPTTQSFSWTVTGLISLAAVGFAILI